MPGFSVNIGADIAQLTAGMNQATAEVQEFGNAIATAPTQALSTLNSVVQSTVVQFDELAASAAALAKINAAIDAAGDAAIQAGAKFDTLGGRLPLQDFNQFRSTIDKFKKDIEGGFKFKITSGSIIPPIPPSVPESFNKTKLGANQAAAALVNVGRVAQDLPFGFIGIANNLNPLLESFQRLKAETGSSKAALQALGTSLMGAGGLGIAVSVVTAALSFASIGLQAWGAKNDEAKKKSDELKSALDNVYSSTAKEVSQVDTLVAVLRNETETRGRRLAAIKELQGIAPEVFKNLKLEGDAVVGLDNAYKAYLANLENVIAVKILQNKLEALIEQRLKKQGNALVGPESFGSLRQMREELQGLRDIQKGGGIVDPEMIRRLESGIKSTQTSLSSLDKQIDETMQRITALSKGVKITEHNGKEEDFLSKQLSLIEKIRDAQKDFTGKMFDLKNIDEATDKLVKLEQQVGNLKLQIAVRDAKKAGLPAAEVEKLKDAIKQGTEKRLNEAFEKEALLLEFSTKLKFSPINRTDIPANIDSQVAKATGLDKKIPVITIQEARIKILGFQKGTIVNETEKILSDLKSQIKETLQKGIGDAFEGIGTAFGEALASGDFGGGLKKAAQSILSVLGGVLQQIGKQVITAALAIKALKATLEKWAIANPGLAIISGIALVALGAALKNANFDGPKFATGGIVSGPIIGQIGEMHRPEVIMPLDRLPQMLRSIGGGSGNDLQFIPIINNEGLYLAVQRGARRVGRKF